MLRKPKTHSNRAIKPVRIIPRNKKSFFVVLTNTIFQKKYLPLFRLFVIALAFFLFIFSPLYIFIKSNNFDKRLHSSVKALNLENTCKEFISNNINSILEIRLNNNEKLEKAIFKIWDKDSILNIDLTAYEFEINKTGAKGNISDYIEINNLYLSNKELYNNLYSILFNKFYLKLDYLFVTNTDSNLETYLYKLNLNSFDKALGSNKNDMTPIYTNLCLKDLKTLEQKLNMAILRSRSINFYNDFQLNKHFDFVGVRKEQLRMHVNNFTGVGEWSRTIQKVFENYDLNIIKIDNSASYKQETQISFSKSDISTKETSQLVLYLLDQKGKDTKISNTILADIYIELGQNTLK